MRGGRFIGSAPRFQPRNSGRTSRPGPGPGGGVARFTPYVDATLGLTASAHLEFVNRRYYWNGGERGEGDFDTFTGAVFGTGDAAGLTGAGTAADHDITLAWSKLNIAEPFVVAAVFRPTLIDGVQKTIIIIEAAATPPQNRTAHLITSTNVARHGTLVNNVAQAQQSTAGALSANTVYAMATLVKTDLFRNSVNGETAGTEDTSGTLPTYNILRFLEALGNVTPFTGSIRHVLFFSQTGGSEISQVDLNTLTTNLAAL